MNEEFNTASAKAMKRIILLISTIIAATVCLSQNITGTITDDAGNPIDGANIMIGGSTQRHTSDSNGQFCIPCNKGELRIVISHEGSSTYDEKIKVEGSDFNIGTISLQKKEKTSDPLHELEYLSDIRTPMTYDSINSEYIERHNIARDIPSILANTPSSVALSESGSGIGFTSYRIRGMGMEAINMTINGIPTSDAESRITMWHHLPDIATSVDKIKITRGAGSSTCGSYAYGANIDLCTKLPSNKPYGNLTIMGGSFGTIKASISAGTGLMKNGFSIDLRMSKIMSNGYISHSDINHNAIMLSAIWHGKSNSLTANIIHCREKSGITMWGCPSSQIDDNRQYNSAGEYFDNTGTKKYYDDEIENHNQTHVQLIYSQKIKGNIEFNIKLFYNRGDGYYEEFLNKQSFASYGLPIISLPTVVTINGHTYSTSTTITHTDLIRRRIQASDYYGGILSATHSIGNFVNTFGGTVKSYNGHYYGNIIWMQYAGNTAKDFKWYSNNSTKTEYCAYYKLEYTFLDKITLYADLQYRIINHEMAGDDSDLLADGKMKKYDEDLDYNFFNPKGGINYEITKKMRLYASVTRTNREPTRNNIKNIIGTNESIEPETLIDYELGYSYKSKIFSGSLNVYYMDFHNQIVPTGEFSQYGYLVATNIDKSYRGGIEATAIVRPHKRVTIEANATFSRNRIKDYTYFVQSYDDELNNTLKEMHVSNTKTAYSPEIIAAGNINYNIFGNFNIYYNVKYVGKQHFDNTSSEDRTIKAYCISSAGFDYAIVTKYVKGMRFKFEVNNIFNYKYSDNAYGGVWYEHGIEKSWVNYFPQAGISFMGGVTISF